MSLNKELVKQLKSYADKDWHRDQLFSSKVISDVAEEWLAKDAEIATLKAELVNREGEKQEMREVIDRLKAEVESYKRAKAENDERFQLEAGALRLDLERERAANAKLRAIVRQEEIDANTIEDRSQEAAHYNWLDDQNEKLLADNAKLREALKVAREALGPSPWGSLRHEIDALLAAKQDEIK